MEAKVLSVICNAPEVIVSANDSKSFRKYLSEGFFVVHRDDGFHKLKKYEILVTIEYEGKQQVINLRQSLVRYYGKAKDYELVARFQNDLQKKRVILKRGSNGQWRIIST